MKKLMAFALLLMCAFALTAQTVEKPVKANAVRGTDGNFTALSLTQAVDSATTFTYTDTKGAKHPVYKSSKGRFYLSKVSKKTGKHYRYYLTTGKSAAPAI